MKVQNFQSKPAPAKAVQWDGSSKMAEEIIFWVTGSNGNPEWAEYSEVLLGLTRSVEIVFHGHEMAMSKGDWMFFDTEKSFFTLTDEDKKRLYDAITEDKVDE